MATAAALKLDTAKRVCVFENAPRAREAAYSIWQLHNLSGHRLNEMRKYALYVLCRLVAEYPYSGMPERDYLWVYLLRELQALAEQLSASPQASGIDPQYKCEYADLVESLAR